MTPSTISPELFDSIDALRAAGFEGFATVADLARSGCLEVPIARGVYVIVRNSVEPPRIMPSSMAGRYRNENPSVKPEVLQEKWVPGAVVLYVAAADGTGVRNQLQQRIKRSIRFGGGAAIGAARGRYVWQLADHRKLLFAWQLTEEAPVLAARLLAAFEARYGAPPFANLRTESAEDDADGAEATDTDSTTQEPDEE
jgi:hypothetical protein